MLKPTRFDIEHALAMHATSYVQCPAKLIYDQDAMFEFHHIIRNCHVYIIGYVPIINFTSAVQKDCVLETGFELLGIQHTLHWNLPSGTWLCDDEDGVYCRDTLGKRFFPSFDAALLRLHRKHIPITFEVQYVGQSYGKSGSRNALNRLLNHETLQRISLEGAKVGYRLQLLMIELNLSNKVITVITPWASDHNSTTKRIDQGTEKLFGTSDLERITLYEASLVRYFQPKYNKDFKDSFPSTNLKVLRDCYEKDFNSIVAELCFDDLPFHLFSDIVSPKQNHVVMHYLHDDEKRRIFFDV